MTFCKGRASILYESTSALYRILRCRALPFILAAVKELVAAVKAGLVAPAAAGTIRAEDLAGTGIAR